MSTWPGTWTFPVCWRGAEWLPTHGCRGAVGGDSANDFLQYQYEVLGIREHLAAADVTEICINRPGEIYLETRAGWRGSLFPR